jgi:hypothetical protein
MAHLWTQANLNASARNGMLQATETGYGLGLAVARDCRFDQIVSHSGGLPGFGSNMVWLPEYGVGMFAMASLTYSGAGAAINQAWDAMLKTGGLKKRELPPTPLQTQMRERILTLWDKWDDAEAKSIGSVNLLLDAPGEQRKTEIQKLKDEVGKCPVAGPVMPENWLRGQFNMTCAKGSVGVFFTMSPTQPPKVQRLVFQSLATGTVRMTAAGPPSGVVCSQ